MDGIAAALERIDRVDGRVGAFTAVDRAPHRTAGGVLDELPVAVKEIFAVRGLPWTAGSLVRRDVVADHDAETVAALRAAGAGIVGVTRSHEFAWGLPTWHQVLGGPRNPWDTRRICGGSSGGSAAAVAAGMVPVALGSDTGCSIRLPAAFCGVVGFKPSHGRIGTGGVVPLAPSFDHVGVIAAEVTDAARVLRVLGVPIGAPVRTGLQGLAVGVARAPQGLPLPTERAHCVQAAVETCADLGARIVGVDLPAADRVAQAYVQVQRGEAYAVHTRELGTWPGRAADYGDDVRRHLERAEAAGADEYAAGIRLTLALREETARVLADVDLLLTPVAACAPGFTDRPHEADVAGRPVALRDAVLPYTQLQDVCGLPACTVPAGADADGMPVGVQLTGRPWADAEVLTAAGLLREALRGRLPARPSLHADG